MNQEQMLNQMQKSGMIPVFNHPDLEVCKKILDAAYMAGIRVFEFTNRSANAFEVFKALKLYAGKYPDLYLGIGTIFTVADASKFHLVGADFIVSPVLEEKVARFCRMKQIFFIPGCATLTEIYRAKTLGAQLVKTFPGELLGPGFIRSVLTVIPDIKLMPTGGVLPNEENLKSWIDAGVHCVGMGSQLFNKEAMKSGDYGQIRAQIEKVLDIINSIKNG